MTPGDRLPFQLTFRGNDAYEARLHRALRRLPRGYAKVVFMRILRGFVPYDASVEQMRHVMENLVTAPGTATHHDSVGSKTRQDEGDREGEGTPDENQDSLAY